MITGIRLENFRAFADSGQLPLKELTCLVGRNSSGKSSVAQALLLLRQSLEERAAGLTLPQLVLNGRTIEAGTYRDVVFKHDLERELGFTFSVIRADRSDSAQRSIGEKYYVPPRAPLRFTSMYFRSPETAGVKLAGPVTTEVTFRFAAHPTLGTNLVRLTVNCGQFGQATFVQTPTGEHAIHWRMYVDDLPPQSVSLRFPGGRLIPFFERRDKGYSKVGPHGKKRVNTFLYLCQHAFWSIGSFFENLRFLGPFRTPPERRYAFGGFGAENAGPTGQHAVDLLITEALTRGKGERPLIKEVSRWLKRLGLARSIEIHDLAKRANLFEVSLSKAGFARKANFADVGFGISQVLPVLIQGLLTPRRGLFIVQQPELHLHPDAQAALADFFIHLSSTGVRSLVETHSEYFLLRLRRRLAEEAKRGDRRKPKEAEENLAPTGRDSVSVLLAKDAGTAGHSIDELVLDESFQFENLPPDFMSAAIHDRLGLLSALSH